MALSLLLVLGPVAGAWAEDAAKPKVLTDAEAVEAVRRAHADSDAAALLALAKADRPDPWVVAEILWATGHLDAAFAFAKAAPRPDTERLPVHVAFLRGKPVPKEAIDALAKAGAAHRAKDGAKALALLEGLDFGAARVHAARARFLQAQVRRRVSAGDDMEGHRKARARYHETLELAEALGWWALAAHATFEEARSAFKVNDFAGAEKSLEHEAALQERRGNLSGVAQALGSIAHFIHRPAGRFREARDMFRRAMGFADRAGDLEHALWCRRGLASMHVRLGELDRALTIYNEVEARIDGLGRPQDRADLLMKRASILRLQGDAAHALEHVEQAAVIYAAVEPNGNDALRRKRKWKAGTLGLRGTLLQELGNLDAALVCQLEAVELRRLVPEEHPLAIALGNLGNLRRQREELAEAEACYEEALKLYENTGDKAGQASVLEGLGFLALLQGEAKEALEQHTRAHALAREAGERHRVLSARLAMAEAHAELNQDAQAIALLEEGAKQARDWEYHRVEMMMRKSAARLQIRSGDHDRALAHVQRGLAMLGGSVGGLAEEEGVVAQREFLSFYLDGIAAARALGRMEDIFDVLERHHTGKLLGSMRARRAPSRAVPQDLLAAVAEAKAGIRAARIGLERSQRRRNRLQIRNSRQALRKAEARLLRAKQRVFRMQRAGAPAHARMITLEAAQAALAPYEALVSYFLPDLPGEDDEARHALALVITPTRVRMVTMAGRTRVESAAAALELEETEQSADAAVATLRGLVVDPLELPASVTRVLIAPHGGLTAVPFALLLPEREVACVSSATVLADLRTQPRRSATGVLAIGDPVYRDEAVGGAVRRSATLARLVPLPGTRSEVERVGTVKLMGAEASEAGFAAALAKQERWRAVHFACHGLVDAERPLFSALALSRDEKNDGFLSCLEILSLRLDVELVASSACETARGKTYETDGVMGLTRTFMIAGARRVLCSLWPVDDRATQALMIKFYELWNPQEGTGSSAAAALKQAQAHVRDHVDAKGERPWAHPYYWAAWVLWGLPE